MDIFCFKISKKYNSKVLSALKNKKSGNPIFIKNNQSSNKTNILKIQKSCFLNLYNKSIENLETMSSLNSSINLSCEKPIAKIFNLNNGFKLIANKKKENRRYNTNKKSIDQYFQTLNPKCKVLDFEEVDHDILSKICKDFTNNLKHYNEKKKKDIKIKHINNYSYFKIYKYNKV